MATTGLWWMMSLVTRCSRGIGAAIKALRACQPSR